MYLWAALILSLSLFSGIEQSLLLKYYTQLPSRSYSIFLWIQINHLLGFHSVRCTHTHQLFSQNIHGLYFMHWIFLLSFKSPRNKQLLFWMCYQKVDGKFYKVKTTFPMFWNCIFVHCAVLFFVKLLKSRYSSSKNSNFSTQKSQIIIWDGSNYLLQRPAFYFTPTLHHQVRNEAILQNNHSKWKSKS